MTARDTTQREIGMAWLDEQGLPLRVSEVLARWVGQPESLQAMLPELDAAGWQRWREGGFAETRTLNLRRRQGQLMKVRVQIDLLPEGGSLVLMWRHLDSLEQATIDALQRRVLRAVATPLPLPEVMDLLCREVEAAAPELICSVLRVDAQGKLHPLAGPSLPPTYSAALEGVAIGPKVGSCGTAAWRREPVEVLSIAADPLWADYKQLALPHGLAACWSTPILLDSDRVAATFALYYRHEAAIAPYHRQLVQACTQLCRVALLHQEHEAHIERLAYYDAITGLPNRALFALRADALLEQQLRLGGSAALLLMDLDRFKAVNELQGHGIGNEVLRRVAERLGHCLPGLNTLARLGDDEFVVLLPGADRAQAERVADGICAAMDEALPAVRGQRLKLGLSIGFSCSPDDGMQLELLLKHADLALNHAKAAGRQCARGFTTAMARGLEEKAWMETALREALAGRSLQLHFQPKLALDDGRLLGAEVLLRWFCEGRGWIAPDRFIPLAEEIGLVNAIDAWVLDAACAQLARWRAEGLLLPGLAVNVSPPRFLHDDVVADVRRLLVRDGLPASCLTLEVTERLMLDGTQDRNAVAQLQQLRAMGVGVSIDDFGTGYSSLSYLRRLPISELKIDRSFVNGLVGSADDQALTRAMVSIAKALRLQIVAEGVETEAQSLLLRELGCDAAQGYWLSRPLDASAFAAWARGRG
jgi:diguanylate cyclase (GGDEF)-like protein